MDLVQVERSTLLTSDTALGRRGATIRSWRELAGDPQREAKLYALDAQSNEDSPSPEPITMPPARQHLDGIFGDPNALPDAFFVAISGDELVGRTNLVRVSDDPEALEADYTGVPPRMARRGDSQSPQTEKRSLGYRARLFAHHHRQRFPQRPDASHQRTVGFRARLRHDPTSKALDWILGCEPDNEYGIIRS